MTAQLSQSDSNFEQAPLFEQTETFVVEEGVTLVQINVEGLTKAKMTSLNIWHKNVTQKPYCSERQMQVTPIALRYADTISLAILKATSMGQPSLLKWLQVEDSHNLSS